jgi:UDP-N-acetylglucosamine--N-acetylmuramyl-(pentapeptide) pyrophosphoryl-undecaprenol N-acetylglucosamine transferase
VTTYLLAGGGTAGHVNPLLATADRLRERDPEAVVLVLGTKEGLESRLVPARGYELLTIPKLPFPRRPDAAALRFPGRLRGSVAAVRAMIRDRQVDVVVGFGGYAAAPAYLAARAESTPIVVHEANARPGIANRLGASLTRHVGTVFEGTRLRNSRVVGMPLRVEIERLDRVAAREEARAFFSLSADRPTLLVTGGSSGAKSINGAVSTSISAILGTGWQVLHVTGEWRDEVVDPGLEGYRVIKYCDRMDLALALADLSLGRSGTGTVVEVTALGIPAVFVPYPVGNGEQRLNARGAVEAGGALLVDDAALTPAWVRGTLVPLLNDRARIAEMAVRSRAVGALDGADRTVDLIESALADASGSLAGTAK